jgi:site-specific DNA-methyltransferase (adenine-specific)
MTYNPDNWVVNKIKGDMPKYELIQGDCLEAMKEIAPGSVDLVLTDPPYGTTQCKWDAVIPFEPMWAAVRRVLKPNGAAVFTASQPFTSALVMSNIREFRYEWVWVKSRVTGVLNAKRQPLRCKEDVLVFSGKSPRYYAQGTVACNKRTSTGVSRDKSQAHTVGKITQTEDGTYTQTRTNWPRQVLHVASEGATVHPTQKPVALMEYLIKTYTNEGETVLDFTMGSGTTGVAAMNTGRNFIGIERDPEYFKIAKKRIDRASATLAELKGESNE